MTAVVAPDGTAHRTAPPGSTRFESYADWLDTRQKAVDAIAAGKSSEGKPIDFRLAPGDGTNPSTVHDVSTVIEYVSDGRAFGRGYIGEPLTPTGQKKLGTVRHDGTRSKVWPDATAVGEGVVRVETTVAWDDAATKWVVVQHYPLAGQTSFDAASKAYTASSPTPKATL